jgi:hypothetical protein
MIFETLEKVLEAEDISNSSLTHSLGPLEMISGLFNFVVRRQPCLSAKNTRMGVGVEFFVTVCSYRLLGEIRFAFFSCAAPPAAMGSWIYLSASVARKRESRVAFDNATKMSLQASHW